MPCFPAMTLSARASREFSSLSVWSSPNDLGSALGGGDMGGGMPDGSDIDSWC